jgi:2,5-diamino-6-(ribosylamino)-4(3H)-pyrimidinone 5'-phosphate reductase
LEDVTDSLKARGYRSLMIEGGSAIISSCLSTPTISPIDRVIITIAPVFVGRAGMGVAASGMEEISR